MHIPHSFNRSRELGVTMTPMIDVVFLLLIFFLCTASFQVVESILPSQIIRSDGNQSPLENIEDEPLERIVVAVDILQDRAVLTVNKSPCPSFERLREILGQLASIDRALPVVLEIAGEVPVGTAVRIYDTARLAGFAKIQFAAHVVP